jgi:hypothetical protein
MAITTLLDPTLLPARTMDQSTFDSAMAYLMTNLPIAFTQMNSTEAGMNGLAAGGAYAIPYTYKAYAAVGFAAGGVLALTPEGGAQTATTTIYVDVINGAGKSVAPTLDTFDDSTSSVKGHILIMKQGDPSKWLLFSVSAVTTSTYYRAIAVALVNSSSASPFTVNDTVMLFFQRTGDKGDKGDTSNGFGNRVVCTSTQSWTPPAGITKAKITVQDGGSGGSNTSGGWGGVGGNAGSSIVTVSSATTYTATIGAGGVVPSGAGGASSFSGSGLTTITSASAQLTFKGGVSVANPASAALGGSSMFGGVGTNGGSSGYGVGGNFGAAGTAGVIVIEY